MTRYRAVTTLAAAAVSLLAFAAPAHADGDIQGGATPKTETIAHRIAAKAAFSGTLLGKAPRPNNPRSDHPSGYAVDFMVDSRAEGDRVAAAARKMPGVAYVMWREADHWNHVHVSVKR